MEWKAIITIYLAVGAPFAAASWLRTGAIETLAWRIVRTLVTLITWPYIGLRSADRLGLIASETTARETDPKN